MDGELVVGGRRREMRTDAMMADKGSCSWQDEHSCWWYVNSWIQYPSKLQINKATGSTRSQQLAASEEAH